MSAAKKGSKKDNQAEPILDANKDAELERKIDQMMDINLPDEPEQLAGSKPEAVEINENKPIDVDLDIDSVAHVSNDDIETISKDDVLDTPEGAKAEALDGLEPAGDESLIVGTAPPLPAITEADVNNTLPDDVPEIKNSPEPKRTGTRKSIVVTSHDDDKSVSSATAHDEDESINSTQAKINELAEQYDSATSETVLDEPEEPEIVGLRGSIIPKRTTPIQPVKPLPLQDDLGLEDVGTARAVDEIIASEADRLLDVDTDGFAAPDEDTIELTPKPKKHRPKQPIGSRVGGFFAAWWHNKLYRNITIGLFCIALVVLLAMPQSRYFVLNTAGVRAKASVKVYDLSTNEPLKNAELQIGDVSAKTDNNGEVTLEKLKLGSSTMFIKKTAFATVSEPVVVGWGSNPLGDFKMQPTGTQYRFNVVDFLSKRPIKNAEVTSGEASAGSNDKGEVTLTVPQAESETVDIQIKAPSYRTESRTIPRATQTGETVAMTPNRKHVFISKRSGTYDVYKIDVDGKNEQKVLPGTGSERSDSMALAQHPNKDIAVLVSTRDNSQNKDNITLSSLNIINLEDNKTTKITQSERIQLVGWSGNSIIYVKIAEGESQTSQTRHRLMSYDVQTNTEKELASSNYFNDVLAVKDSVYYSPAAYNVKGAVGLYRVNANGTDKKTVYDKEVWNIVRTGYDKLSVSIGQEWFDLNVDNNALTRAAGAPANTKSKIYVQDPNNTTALWVDERDGKGALVLYDPKQSNDKVLLSQSGLKQPVYWLNQQHVIYRVNNNQETADYIYDVNGGEPRKIKDVTDTAGIDRWYYY